MVNGKKEHKVVRIGHMILHKGLNQYSLTMQTADQTDINSWFTFDKRTRTLRTWLRKNLAISNHIRKPWARKSDLVARSYNTKDQS